MGKVTEFFDYNRNKKEPLEVECQAFWEPSDNEEASKQIGMWPTDGRKQLQALSGEKQLTPHVCGLACARLGEKKGEEEHCNFFAFDPTKKTCFVQRKGGDGSSSNPDALYDGKLGEEIYALVDTKDDKEIYTQSVNLSDVKEEVEEELIWVVDAPDGKPDGEASDKSNTNISNQLLDEQCVKSCPKNYSHAMHHCYRLDVLNECVPTWETYGTLSSGTAISGTSPSAPTKDIATDLLDVARAWGNHSGRRSDQVLRVVPWYVTHPWKRQYFKIGKKKVFGKRFRKTS